MKIELSYKKRSYGNGYNVTKYDISLRKHSYIRNVDGACLSILVNFGGTLGRDWQDESSVQSCEITLAKQQAILLAQAILDFYSENEQLKNLSLHEHETIYSHY